MFKNSLSLLLVVLVTLNIYPQENIPSYKHSFISELEKLHDFEDLPTYRSDSEIIQISSYDRTGGNDDGFSGKYSYIKRNEDSTLVIFKANGSGVINRIWTPTPNSDTLDFYIGDTAKVSFSIKFSDLFSGDVYPFIKPMCGNQIGGYFSYIPIPFEEGCKIVSRGKHIQFLQIQYRKFNNDAIVEDFSFNLNSQEKDALSHVASIWDGDWDIENLVTNSGNLLAEINSITLKPGEKQTIFSATKGGRILGIEIDNAVLFIGKNNDVDIKISWDDENIPAIYSPIADFFGYAFGNISMQSILSGTKDNKNYCYIPMPYDKKAKIEIIYRKGERDKILHINTRVYYSEQKRDKEEGRLYVAWNRVLESEEGKPLLMADVKGKGHYIGTIMQTQGLNPGMTLFFEGDDIALVDGVNTIHGTGSEDYFNGGWYAFLDRWDTKMSLPIHGSLDYSLPFSRTGGYRWHLTDKISFNKSLNYTMEHGPVGNKIPVNNTTLGFYYCDTPKSEYIEPDNNLSAVYFPKKFLLYPQLMSYDIWRDIDIKTEWCTESGGYTYIFKVDNESRLRISLKEIPHGKYKLYLDINNNPEGCDVSLWQRQTQISELISLFSSEKERLKNLFVCDIEIGEFQNTLTFRFKTIEGKNNFLLNRLILVKK